MSSVRTQGHPDLQIQVADSRLQIAPAKSATCSFPKSAEAMDFRRQIKITRALGERSKLTRKYYGASKITIAILAYSSSG